MGLTKIKFWLYLRTACGCTRIIEWPEGKNPPMHYHVALPRKCGPFDQLDMFANTVLDQSHKRTFELVEKHEVGPNEFLLKYKEIVAG